MKRAVYHHSTRRKGFTLIESIILLTALSIVAVGIVSLQGKIFSGRSDSRDMEVGTQLLQACAEQVLATRQRTGGYDLVTTSTCSHLLDDYVGHTFEGFAVPSITITADTSAACPSGSTCIQVVISVSKSGASLTPITLELVSY